MRIVAILIFFILFNLYPAFGQLSGPEKEQEDMLITGHPGFYFDTGKPLLNISDELTCFEFFLFDRWGNIVVSSIYPHFIIEDALHPDKELTEGESYVYLVKYTTVQGEEKRLIGTLNCLGKHPGL